MSLYWTLIPELPSYCLFCFLVEWSCSEDFSPPAGEIIMDNLQSLRCTITGLTMGQCYYVRVYAYNMKGWGQPQTSTPPCASPSSKLRAFISFSIDW
ncbi:hypothetical protein JD844_011145 [Phrynosoma platyrhinos]|uniref:Fibronectin type-III domain-containing protein n=1 Tax=Phrynosoma platyrhinos TaxID=52577 RepID=A0ABQ7TIR3_PHRPL|nr:hypothetical protein JD844_011145 [Phrynosoma platyrhinos]